MASANTAVSLAIRRRLTATGALTTETLELAMEQSRENGKPLLTHLLDENFLSGARLAEILSLEYSVPVYDIDQHQLESSPEGIVDAGLMKKHQALPLHKRGNRLFIAISDPRDHLAIADIRFHTGLQVEPVLADANRLDAVIEAFCKSREEAIHDSLDGYDSALGDMDMDVVDSQGGEANEVTLSEAEEAPIVKFVNRILLNTIQSGASDIHFEPYETSYRVRARVDGILAEVTRPPVKLGRRLAARLKVMSKMDISERRKPQDGRIKLRLAKNRSIDFRVNTLPTIHGEKVVLRILDPGSAQIGIAALGYEDWQKDLYMEVLHQSQGMILITGPTGSGKTVSLYTGLNILNTEERNISTAEDPVEINLEGINQVQVDAKVGLTFAEALRSFLRQDPDIVMVGEIRDLETAEIAIKAAQTGHMVLSTLHTNSAPETLNRLLNMGIPAFNVASTVSLIIAQRLARKLCPTCKKPADLPEKILREEGLLELGIARDKIRLMDPAGCSECEGKGQRGRTGIYEVMAITPEIAQMIMQGGNALELAKLSAEQGFDSLRRSALRKVAAGEIHLAEANRVTTD